MASIETQNREKAFKELLVVLSQNMRKENISELKLLADLGSLVRPSAIDLLVEMRDRGIISPHCCAPLDEFFHQINRCDLSKIVKEHMNKYPDTETPEVDNCIQSGAHVLHHKRQHRRSLSHVTLIPNSSSTFGSENDLQSHPMRSRAGSTSKSVHSASSSLGRASLKDRAYLAAIHAMADTIGSEVSDEVNSTHSGSSLFSYTRHPWPTTSSKCSLIHSKHYSKNSQSFSGSPSVQQANPVHRVLSAPPTSWPGNDSNDGHSANGDDLDAAFESMFNKEDEETLEATGVVLRSNLKEEKQQRESAASEVTFRQSTLTERTNRYSFASTATTVSTITDSPKAAHGK